MESRKMALLKLFAGQQWRNRQRTDLWTWEEGRKEQVGCMERVTWKLTLPFVKQTANGNLLSDSGNSNQGSVMTKPEVGWGQIWEEGSRGKGHMCTYD